MPVIRHNLARTTVGMARFRWMRPSRPSAARHPALARATCALTGSRKRAASHCAYAEDGQRLMATCARADPYVFADFPKEVDAKFGRVGVLADNHSARFSLLAMEFVKRNRERPDMCVRLVRLPAGCPFPSVAEQCWSQLEMRAVAGERRPAI